MARFSSIFEQKEKPTDKYKALCSKGGRFDGCSVFIKNKKLNSISIYGISEIDICDKFAKVGYRSNPSSPYKKINSGDDKLATYTRLEKGIDHDFLFSVPKKDSLLKERLIVRFKNHKVAIDFADIIDLYISTCKINK